MCVGKSGDSIQSKAAREGERDWLCDYRNHRPYLHRHPHFLFPHCPVFQLVQEHEHHSVAQQRRSLPRKNPQKGRGWGVGVPCPSSSPSPRPLPQDLRNEQKGWFLDYHGEECGNGVRE